MDIKSRLDLTQVFCDVDDFYKAFQTYSQTLPLLTSSVGEKLCSSRLSLSEVMTIVIAFHGSGYLAIVLPYLLIIPTSFESVAKQPP